ncbi:MAG: hypothetical protein NWQ28_05650 [Nodularia sp. (in: cyanobacteria)]|nr:hypothetical protein [Nodularia sp. (in: cyanobacteria)]
MKQLKEAVRQAIAQGNWYSALASALTLPDICGWLEYPEKNVSERYTHWYDTYMKEKYGGFYDESERLESTFLSGKDCYALRCAYLHNGQDDITGQNARESLNEFLFITPSKSGELSKHLVRKGVVYDETKVSLQLQLEVDKFCEDICCGVDIWESNIAMREDIQERIKQLLIIVEN